MKKLIGILSIAVIALSSNISAQSTQLGSKPAGRGTIPVDMISLNFSSTTDGTKTVEVPNGKGTIKIVKNGNKFSDVVYTDAAGKSTRLIPNSGSTGNLPKADCKYPIPDACFSSPDKTIGMCMCRPTNITNGGGENEAATIVLSLIPIYL